MTAWIAIPLVLLVISSPGWGILLVGYIKYKRDWHRMELNCPACQAKEPSMVFPDELRPQFCVYHRHRYDQITRLEIATLGQYPSIEA